MPANDKWFERFLDRARNAGIGLHGGSHVVGVANLMLEAYNEGREQGWKEGYRCAEEYERL